MWHLDAIGYSLAGILAGIGIATWRVMRQTLSGPLVD
jgi:hypothetical protein